MALKKFFQGIWLILLIIFIASAIRFYRLPSLITFGGDQGIDLLVVKRMIIDHRWTLLGPKTSILAIYNGPAYYYLILPVLYLFKLDPLSVSYFMVLLWLGAIFLTYIFGKEIFNKRVGILAALFFSIWPVSVEYSRQSFNSFPTPLFAIVFLLGIHFFIQNKKILYIIFAGLSFGIMLQLHYFNFLLGFIVFFYLFVKKYLDIKSFLCFLGGVVLTLSPFILFELRHNLFNTRTLFLSFSNGGMSSFEFKTHYLIAFFPVAFIFLAYILDRIYLWKKILGLILIIFLVFININKIEFSRTNGFTMPEGWNYLGVKKASQIIAKDASGDFNIAAILDGDTRGYPYRYIIEIAGKQPKGVEEYTNLKNLYVVARGSENDVLNYPVWEIQTFLPAKISKTWEIQNNIKVFKLEKDNKK